MPAGLEKKLTTRSLETLAAGGIAAYPIDVQGARQVRRVFRGALLIFVLPPSADELTRRLSGRASEVGTRP